MDEPHRFHDTTIHYTSSELDDGTLQGEGVPE